MLGKYAIDNFKELSITTLQKYKLIATRPFNSKFKYSYMIVQNIETKEISIFIKGAPEIILNLCSNPKPEITEQFHNLSSKGMRTLALASGKLESFYNAGII